MTNYSALKSTGAPGFPPGFIIPWANNSLPVGFLLCDGSNVSRTTYADLFAAIGTTYGAGDGGTTFGLPNLDGRSLLFQAASSNNVGTTAGNTNDTIDPASHVILNNNQGITVAVNGNIVGHAITVNQMPAHSHTVNTNFRIGNNDVTRNNNNIADGGASVRSVQPNFATSSKGGSQEHAHNHNVQVNTANLNGNVDVNYNAINTVSPSTRLKAVIKT